jgi:hypothetical protein
VSKLVIEVSDTLREKASHLAKQEGLSLEEFAAQALAAQIIATEASARFSERARRGNRADFDAVLAKVADTPPADEDRL